MLSCCSLLFHLVVSCPWCVMDTGSNSRVTSWFQRRCTLWPIPHNLDEDSFRNCIRRCFYFSSSLKPLKSVAHRLRLFSARHKLTKIYQSKILIYAPKPSKYPKPCIKTSITINLLMPQNRRLFWKGNLESLQITGHCAGVSG